MEQILILDGISLAIFLVLIAVISIITIISCIGWMYESAQRTVVESRLHRLEDEIKVDESCQEFKKDYGEYMRKLEERLERERSNV